MRTASGGTARKHAAAQRKVLDRMIRYQDIQVSVPIRGSPKRHDSAQRNRIDRVQVGTGTIFPHLIAIQHVQHAPLTCHNQLMRVAARLIRKRDRSAGAEIGVVRVELLLVDGVNQSSKTSFGPSFNTPSP